MGKQVIQRYCGARNGHTVLLHVITTFPSAFGRAHRNMQLMKVHQGRLTGRQAHKMEIQENKYRSRCSRNAHLSAPFSVVHHYKIHTMDAYNLLSFVKWPKCERGNETFSTFFCNIFSSRWHWMQHLEEKNVLYGFNLFFCVFRDIFISFRLCFCTLKILRKQSSPSDASSIWGWEYYSQQNIRQFNWSTPSSHRAPQPPQPTPQHIHIHLIFLASENANLANAASFRTKVLSIIVEMNLEYKFEIVPN